MANENKNIKELVSDDDDATAELEAITERQFFGRKMSEVDLEGDQQTYNFTDHDEFDGVSMSDLKADLRLRSDTIEKLQFDIEQLRAKWLGLETEIKAREELTSNLATENKAVERKLERKEKLLVERDRSIKSLKGEIRTQELAFRDLQKTADESESARKELVAGDEITEARQTIALQEGALASARDELTKALADQHRTEEYADGLRRKLADIASTTDKAINDCVSAKTALKEFEERYQHLTDEFEELQQRALLAEGAMTRAAKDHKQEIRTLRFELGEAEQTLTKRERISEQLASDLVDTRTFKEQLERELTENYRASQAHIQELEKRNQRLGKTIVEQEEKLESKSDAINGLLAELAKKSSEIHSIGEMEDVIQEIDDRMSERIDEHAIAIEDERSPADRIARLLIGRIDNQELRFPLFKDRLTIGRTQQNDIQLKAQYISRRHAVVETEGDTTRVIDWGSKNGVYVNKKRVTEHFLKNGDILKIGTAEFRYEERPKRDT